MAWSLVPLSPGRGPMVCFTSIKKASSISRVQISSSSSPTKQQPEEKRRQEETHPSLRTPILAERRHENPSVLPHIRLARRARAIEQQAPPPPPLPCSEQRYWIFSSCTKDAPFLDMLIQELLDPFPFMGFQVTIKEFVIRLVFLVSICISLAHPVGICVWFQGMEGEEEEGS